MSTSQIIDEKAVLNALSKVMDPELNRNLVELNMIRDIEISQDSKVKFNLALTIAGCPLKDRMAEDARQALLALPGITEVEVSFTTMTDEEREKIMPKGALPLPKISQFNTVQHVLAIMSGKGGVGKSSVTAMLAVALTRMGQKVGILDADITGPSIPRFFGLPPGGLRGSQQGILPAITSRGIKIMSTNLLLQGEDQPVIWRGPMITGVIQQFWNDTLWGKLDYLLVDLPLGTSDAALTVTQQLPLQGVILVTTPQELAAMVVKKAVGMIHTLGIPLVGVVENMSYFLCPDNNKQYELFGSSHAAEIAQSASCDVLARLSIQPDITRLCDSGKVEAIDLPEMNALSAIVHTLVEALPPPKEKA